jgi:ubiquinone/menaquinone biosynthesis C-methylase UbiE
MKNAEEVKSLIRGEYEQAARQAKHGGSSCCSTAGAASLISGNLYHPDQIKELPMVALAASLGCGNPTALAEMHPGETVLDLGSGGGIDVLLSARRVGPTGKVYGLDMTDEMLALARENQEKAGVQNLEFLKGEIEQIPLADESVDLIISNCVINLSPEKDRVLAEAYRVLKPGGRLAISDIVVQGTVPAEVRHSIELWMGCVAGALEKDEYRDKLRQAGFEAVEIVPTRIYGLEDARDFLAGAGLNIEAIAPQIQDRFMSAYVRARKPVGN